MVETGLERALSSERHLLLGKRLGLLVNPTSVDRRFRHTIDLFRADGLDVRALFGPEHGIRGEAQDMISVDTAVDPRSGLPVHSLYGHSEASLSPTPAMLSGLDAIVFDIQDVGSRYYTYLWTLALTMKVAAAAGVQVIVLDRPNPLGGVDVEGGRIAPGYQSFVGLYDIPNRHGLTAGELARHVNGRFQPACDLVVIAMSGWRRTMFFEDTGVPWVNPSPNMPTPNTAFVYPGMCLVEGTELSEARGTTLPFELFGAPWLDGDKLAQALAREALPGVIARPLTFRPTFHKFAAQVCGGIQLQVTDRRAFRPYRTGIAVLAAARAQDPSAFQWRRQAYEFVADRPAIDLLAGGPELREGIDAGASLDTLCGPLAAAEAAFLTARADALMYG